MDEQANQCCKRDHGNGFKDRSALERQRSLDGSHERPRIFEVPRPHLRILQPFTGSIIFYGSNRPGLAQPADAQTTAVQS